IGSGKSEIGKILSEKGFPVISTDELAKSIMVGDTKVKLSLIDEFGQEVYDTSGKLNSKLLSEIVFKDDKYRQQRLDKLNSIVHPPVIDLMVTAIEDLILKGHQLIFVESALIYEAGLDNGFDYVICVSAEDEIRINRTIQRNNLCKEDVMARMGQQLSQELKISHADFNIVNNKSLKDLKDSVDFLLPILQTLPPKNIYSSEETGS
ncbi:MAG: dephospho-CoA kinase, partial [Candidatus Kapabacteria bacterium]|nr:dephospho-CoA kinase [Candidatus Kapabacteria bacterium]